MMRTMPRNNTSSGGFTLLEILIAITVSAIVAVVLVDLFSNATARSWRPMENLTRSLTLQSAMDQVASDYRNLMLTDPQPLVTLQNNIRNRIYFTGTAVAATDNYCLDFIETSPGSEQWGEGNSDNTCSHPTHTLLKVTLSLDTQTLTSLYSR